MEAVAASGDSARDHQGDHRRNDEHGEQRADDRAATGFRGDVGVGQGSLPGSLG